MAVNAFLTFYDKADGATDSFTDYKPTESLKADDNFIIINWLAEDHFKVDPSDPSVDPNNPNSDGLLLPAVKAWDWEVNADDPNTLTSDVTDQSVEVLGQPAETLEIAHEGFLR